MEIEDIVKRYTTDKGIHIANLVTELHERITALEEAMVFFNDWYDKMEAKNKPIILVPEHLKNGNSY